MLHVCFSCDICDGTKFVRVNSETHALTFPPVTDVWSEPMQLIVTCPFLTLDSCYVVSVAG